MFRLGQIAGGHVAGGELTEGQAAFVHGANDVGFRAFTKAHLRTGDDSGLERAGEFVVANRRQFGSNVGDRGVALRHLRGVAYTRGLAISLQANAVERSNGDTWIGAPRFGADLPLIRAARSELIEELHPGREQRSGVG